MKAHEHDASSPILQHALKSTLPHSINLVYRTKHPNRTQDAHILATFAQDSTSVPKCWAVAYLDRSMRPETELWIFAAGEVTGHHSESEFCPDCREAVLVLLDYMATLSVPDMHEENLPSLELAKQHEREHPELKPDVKIPLTTGAYLRHMLLPSVLSLGACHHQVVQICSEAGLLREEFPGRDAELYKYLFRVSDLPQARELPEGLKWGQMRKEDIAVVQSRTAIPRAARTLLSLKSVRVYEEKTDKLVGWTFLGLDGSLTTLHTEPEHRGQGIAKAVAVKIFKEHAPGLAVDEDGNAWAHADVYVGNTQSESVCKSLGGKAAVKIYWVRIDLARAGTLVNSI